MSPVPPSVASSANESKVISSANESKVISSANDSKVASANESKVISSANDSKVASANDSKNAPSGGAHYMLIGSTAKNDYVTKVYHINGKLYYINQRGELVLVETGIIVPGNGLVAYNQRLDGGNNNANPRCYTYVVIGSIAIRDICCEDNKIYYIDQCGTKVLIEFFIVTSNNALDTLQQQLSETNNGDLSMDKKQTNNFCDAAEENDDNDCNSDYEDEDDDDDDCNSDYEDEDDVKWIHNYDEDEDVARKKAADKEYDDIEYGLDCYEETKNNNDDNYYAQIKGYGHSQQYENSVQIRHYHISGRYAIPPRDIPNTRKNKVSDADCKTVDENIPIGAELGISNFTGTRLENVYRNSRKEWMIFETSKGIKAVHKSDALKAINHH